MAIHDDGELVYVANARGDTFGEFTAIMRDKKIAMAIRLHFMDLLIEICSGRQMMAAHCAPLAEDVHELDFLAGSPDSRKLRPWAGLASIEGSNVLVHAKQGYTGGKMERAMAVDETLERYRMENAQ